MLICVSTDYIFRTYYHTSNFFSHTHFILCEFFSFQIYIYNNQPNTNVERDVYYSSTYYKA